MAEQSTRLAFLEIVPNRALEFRGVSRATLTCGDAAFRGSSVHSGRGDSGRVVGNSSLRVILPVYEALGGVALTPRSHYGEADLLSTHFVRRLHGVQEW